MVLRVFTLHVFGMIDKSCRTVILLSENSRSKYIKSYFQSKHLEENYIYVLQYYYFLPGNESLANSYLPRFY